MTSGVEGTGPYAKLKELRTQLRQFKYELRLVNEGHKRKCSEATYLTMIKGTQDKIRKINLELKSIRRTS